MQHLNDERASAAVPNVEWSPSMLFARTVREAPYTMARERLSRSLTKLKSCQFLDVSLLTPRGSGTRTCDTLSKYHLRLDGILGFIASRTLEGIQILVSLLTEKQGLPQDTFRHLLLEFSVRYYEMPKHENVRTPVKQDFYHVNWELFSTS